MANSAFERNDGDQVNDVRKSAASAQSSQGGVEADLQTLGQLMRAMSQGFRRLYKEQLGYGPGTVSCYLIERKLLVWVEGGVSKLERMLVKSSTHPGTALRPAITRRLREPIAELVYETLKVSAVTVLTDTAYESECTAWVVLLSEKPKMRRKVRYSDQDEE